MFAKNKKNVPLLYFLSQCEMNAFTTVACTYPSTFQYILVACQSSIQVLSFLLFLSTTCCESSISAPTVLLAQSGHKMNIYDLML